MHSQPFGVTVCDRTLRVHGELDLATSDQLVEAVALVAACVEQHTLVVDLAWVSFIDSEGLGALLDAHQRLQTIGKDLVLHNVPSRVHKTMRLAGLADYLSVRSVVA